VEQRIKVLQLEDNEADGELISVALERAGLILEVTRVERRAAFLLALEAGGFDLILSDFSLPDFDGLSALSAVRQRDYETPFIFVSGTIGEERAVEALRNGATDYVLKDRLSRLPAAIRRAIQDRDERRSQRRSEDRVRDQAALLDEAREAIVIQDLDRRVTYWNKGAEKIYGWTSEEAEARFDPGTRADLDAAWRAVLEAGQWDGSLNQITRAGAEIIVESHWTCLRHPDGSPRAVISSSSDVTQARNLEAQLLRTQRLETVGTIASGVAHDLNNVLAPIIIGLTSLKRRVTDAPGQKLVNAMEVSAERGAEIVKQVLTFARGTGALTGMVNTRDVVQGIEKLLAATLPRNVKLTMNFAPDLWPISADPTQLQQVLLNLCVNARDAMPRGGEVTIDAANAELSGEREGRYIALIVTDSGCGMDRSTLSKIFEPFFTTKTQGTGIGLSTVASIVKRHDGFIDVQSEVGRGTSFKVCLPAHERRRAAMAPPVPQGDGKLLLVVDEASMREMMARTLEAYGYRVVSVGDANGALHEYARRQSEIAAVLVNFSMPDLDAVGLVDALAERGQPVRIINTSRTRAAQGDAGGQRATASLPTPYTPDKLLEVVGQVVNAA
jgi:two-component system, cell cycle sensor histidine kinase and response regulator CckA